MFFLVFTKDSNLLNEGSQRFEPFFEEGVKQRIGWGPLYRHDLCSALLHSITGSTENGHTKVCSTSVWVSCSDLSVACSLSEAC